MTETINNNKNILLPFIILILGATILQIGITYASFDIFSPKMIVLIHIYLGIILIGSHFILKKIKSIDENKVGLAFLAMTMFKMMLAIGFLLIIFNVFEFKRMIIISHFFAPFFLYLIFEVILTLKLIR
jgi:hypothetical protein